MKYFACAAIHWSIMATPPSPNRRSSLLEGWYHTKPPTRLFSTFLSVSETPSYYTHTLTIHVLVHNAHINIIILFLKLVIPYMGSGLLQKVLKYSPLQEYIITGFKFV